MARARSKRKGIKRLINNQNEPIELSNLDIVKELIRMENRLSQNEREIRNLRNDNKMLRIANEELESLFKNRLLIDTPKKSRLPRWLSNFKKEDVL